MKNFLRINFLLFVFSSFCFAQINTSYWQQHVDYAMEIDMDVNTYQYNGKQKLVYTNNSPDTLDKVFYHLYFNAFQPGSQMDIRVQTLADPDRRMVDNVGTKENPVKESRISKLKPNEIGFIKVNSLKQDGEKVKYTIEGTIMKVVLNTPIEPGQKTTFDIDFLGQVPVQIRRSGRNNKEGVALSMTQWYPKLAEYDFEGWHADEYIQREFHGVWGDFDVKITIDKDYVLGGTGYLQNPNEIGHGYETSEVMKTDSPTLTWHFKAPNVHDFTWAADPDYLHDQVQVPNGPTLHFLYQNDPEILDNWKELQPKSVELMTYFSENIGKYPYDQYSIIQGGDGGMEYGMCTLITGRRPFPSLFGVTAHEMAHSWFQFLLATNEAKHEWMDEGFTSYIDSKATNDIFNRGLERFNAGSYRSYQRLVESGFEQPLTTHADRYRRNSAYGAAAYSKGSVFLSQLGYIIGQDNLDKTLKEYFNAWAFKHPTPNDFIRVAEKVSGIELDWYLIDWAQSTNTIDYGITSVSDNDNGKTMVVLENKGSMPMPLDVMVTYEDNSTTNYYIPLQMMRGAKKTTEETVVLKDWPWVKPSYFFYVEEGKKVAKVTIDPKKFMADINLENNTLEVTD
ncbi:MAG: M1 family metallopeptidase [bacterium]